MKYKKGFKYQLVEDEIFLTNIYPKEDIITPFAQLLQNGALTGYMGYAWDGPSGPCIDRKTNMRGSLGHDILFQFMRQYKLPQDSFRRANYYMGVWCKEDKMNKWLANMYVRELNNFSSFAANPRNQKKVYEAP